MTVPRRHLPPQLRGAALLHDPQHTKGTAFTEGERDAFGLRGLLPPRVLTIAQQAERVLRNFRTKPNPLEQYVFLTALQDRSETLFYRVLVDHIVEMMPVVYTPTVGEACRKFGHIYRRPRGLYLTIDDRGRVAEVMANWSAGDVAIIVATDGERILGLGDLGAYGMGIPIGKLALYTACAGVDPSRCLPVMLDVGTDNATLLEDPLYTGLVRRRVRGPEYAELVEEFVAAVEQRFPRAILQFEDFATENAFGLLARYRDRLPCFNDDIQGTAAVVLAGLRAAGRITNQPLPDQRLLFYGAGAAATGIADLIVAALVREGMTPEAARARCWFVDSKGLVVRGRTDLASHKRPYAHEHARAASLLEAVEALRPTAILGLSAQPDAFTAPVLEAMARHNPRPIVLALSNPTSKAECTAEAAYRYTEGRAVFASGSPFAPVEAFGRRFEPGQGNNAYIFPGLGLGAVACGARRITDAMFLAAAETLAAEVTTGDLERGTLYPPVARIREVSAAIATAVVRVALAEGVATIAVPDPATLVAETTYHPHYPDYLADPERSGLVTPKR
ncbi:MAG: NAD-dependent malic enzyme [Gemmatimonadales bacterium]